MLIGTRQRVSGIHPSSANLSKNETKNTNIFVLL
jgi:hypothetical protein